MRFRVLPKKNFWIVWDCKENRQIYQHVGLFQAQQVAYHENQQTNENNIKKYNRVKQNLLRI